MDRRKDRVGRRRQEAVDLMRPGYRLGFGATIAVERRPDAGEGKQWPLFAEGEPHHVFLLRLRVRLRRILGEAVGRNETPVFRLQPHPPVC